MKLEYRSDYFDDAKALQSFERSTKKIHGLDFSLWKSKGLWDEKYRAFSAFIENECIASICAYPSEMKIDGVSKKGAQLLTVGTLPEYRLMGIQREIWSRAHDWIKKNCDFTFLFTDDSAAGFYERLGLRRQEEFSESMSCPKPSAVGKIMPRKINLNSADDYKILERLVKKREMVSDRIGFKNFNLSMFMYLYEYSDISYYIESLDAVVVAEESDTRLLVHDIVAEKIPDFSDLEVFISLFGKEELVFLFCTDRLAVGPLERSRINGSVLCVSNDFQLDGKYLFPYSIRA